MINLFINSPSYYTQQHGVIDEVYELCTVLSKSIDIQNYTTLLDTIGITPIIAPATALCDNTYKEVTMISLPYRMANISLLSDYNQYAIANELQKQQIIVENILRSLYVIKKRLREAFDYDRLKADIETIANEQRRNR